MIIIGLTGNYGMGKSTVARMFKELGAVVIDTDAIVRELLKDPGVIYEIKKAFGEDIIQHSAVSGQPSEINKKMLADIVFEQPHLRVSLEDILHPVVFRKIDEEIKRLNSELIVIVEAPVIFERGYQNRFDKIITVFTSEDVAVSRLREKGISEDESRKRLKSQFPIAMKVQKSDFSIDNNKDLENTKRRVEEIYKELGVMS